MEEVKEELKNTKALKIVTLRNKFFYLGYRSALVIFAISFMIFVSSLYFAYIFAMQPVAPIYIPIKPDGTYIDLVRVDQENKTEQEIADFIVKGVRKLYTRDFINYSDQLMESSYFFTSPAWNTYLTSLQQQKTIEAMKENQWVVSFTPRSAPTLLEKKLVNGYFTWAYEYSGTINYVGAKGRQQGVKMQIIVQRTSIVDSAQGVGIALIVATDEK